MAGDRRQRERVTGKDGREGKEMVIEKGSSSSLFRRDGMGREER